MNETDREVAVVVGVGPGLGWALVKRFAAAGMQVVAAARHMVAAGRGTILFTGATASLRGGAGFAALAVPKFGLRALAQF